MDCALTHVGATCYLPLAEFLLVSIPTRAIRFVLTSVLAAMIAAPLRRRVRERTLIHIHLLAWTAFYTAYFVMVR